jgi:hypothetical protein
MTPKELGISLPRQPVSAGASFSHFLQILANFRLLCLLSQLNQPFPEISRVNTRAPLESRAFPTCAAMARSN